MSRQASVTICVLPFGQSARHGAGCLAFPADRRTDRPFVRHTPRRRQLDNWVYDLEGKPWGVTEVEEKLLSLRAEDDGRTTTRRFIRPKIAREKPAGENVRVELHHQKRLDGAIPDGRLNLSSLRDGEWTWLDLDRDETRRLYHHLESLYALGGADAQLRAYQHFQVSGPGEAVIPKEYIELIEAIAKDRGPEVFTEPQSPSLSLVGARGDKPPLGTLMSRPICRWRSRLLGWSDG